MFNIVLYWSPGMRVSFSERGEECGRMSTVLVRTWWRTWLALAAQTPAGKVLCGLPDWQGPGGDRAAGQPAGAAWRDRPGGRRALPGQRRPERVAVRTCV